MCRVERWSTPNLRATFPRSIVEPQCRSSAARGRPGKWEAGMTVELFISHAHADEELAQLLVDAIEASMTVPAKSIRCTSVPGYQLALGDMPRDVLRQELSSAKCVIALLTPHSVDSVWCQFELGAA